ncbi:MAG: nuclear transport factor 2 family protein [Sphingomonadaceae bacterium]
MTDDDTRNLATARRLYEAAGRGDWEAAERELHDDLVIHEAESLPYAGAYRGKDALRRLVGMVLGHWPNAGLERLGMAAGDGRVVVFFRMRIDAPAGPLVHEIVEVNEFRDGKVAVIKPFYWDAGFMAKLAHELGKAA